MNYFGKSTKRITRLREEMLETQPTVCIERAVLVTESYNKHKNKLNTLKRAYALDNVLRNMSIYIEDGGLIVGNQAEVNRGAPVFPEYAMDWLIAELDEFEKRDGDRFVIEEGVKTVLRNEIAPFWMGIGVKDKALALMPEYSRTLYDIGLIKAEGNITAGDGHMAVHFEKVLSIGLEGYREQVIQSKGELDLCDFAQYKKQYFYDAVLIVIDAVIAFAQRFSNLASELAACESDEKRKKELLSIAQACAHVPRHPARNFQEAVQSAWFIQLILQIESSGHSVSFGRFDQYIYPFYKKDIKSGLISKEYACEILEHLWLKMLSINKVRSKTHTKFGAGSPLYQNVCIGGQDENGNDAVNDLSFLILHTIGRMRLTQPNLSVRYHKNISDKFMYDCIQMIKLGFGMPSFNNDEVIIPSFMKRGVSKVDAYNYCSIGCIEVAIPGRFGLRCSGMSFLNFPKVLMVALNDGVDVVSGKKVWDGVGHFVDFETFDDVLNAWDKAIRHYTRQCVIMDYTVDYALETEVPDILCSALIDDCIARGLHVKEGGAVYDMIGDLQVGIANTGDSLAAIKKLVFEEGVIGKKELWDALVSNFEGEHGELIRNKLIYDAPKYGNDDDYVDSLAVWAYEVCMDEMENSKNSRFGRGPIGGNVFPSTSSISANVPQGRAVSATPDGRKAFMPLAEGCSPSHGVDVNGPTAVIKSVSKLPSVRMTGGVLLNQKFSPSALQNDRDIKKLIMLIRTFFDDLQGFHVQFNVVERKTLLDAQKHPENYRDLIVRVAGYSAFFNQLSTETQDDIIARTEHTLAG